MFDAFIPSDGVYNRATMTAVGDWPHWILVLCVLLSLAVLALCWRNLSGLSTRIRIVVFGCRCLSILILFGMLFEVSLRLEKVQNSPSKVVVLVDQSRSMTLPAASSSYPSRIEVANDFLKRQKPALDMLAKNHEIEFLGFGGRVKPLKAETEIKATEEDTDFLKVFEYLDNRQTQNKLVGAILLSDGVDTRLPENAGVSGAMRDALDNLDAPIHTVTLTKDEPIVDLAIERVAHDDFAFVRNAVSFDVSLSASGHKGESVAVRLEENGKEVAVKQVQLLPEQNDYAVTFELVPDTRGQSVFRVSAEALEGELIVENNHHSFVVQVIRDKIRVLQVVGRPTWDVRALRRMLKQNPNVDLISFFILRTNDSVDAAATHELSLIPFPTDELFYQELGSFDLVIFQNFTHRGFRMTQYLPRIRDFINDGGGFVMIGGDQSFARGGFSNTPFAQFLPVIMGESDGIETTPFKAELTEVGKTHPITRLIQSSDENQSAWSALRKMNGWNAVSGVAAGADVLLTTPKSTGAHPFVAVRDFGKGRVLSVMGDDTWRWAFGADGAGMDPHFYYRFWGNAIRWLIRDPALNRLKVSTRSDKVRIDSPFQVEARLSTASFLPAQKIKLNAQVNRLGSKEPASVGEVQSATTDQQGVARFEFTLEQAGEYLIRVSVPTDETVEATLPVIVSHEPRELRRVKPNPGFLSELSAYSSGQTITLDEDLDALNFRVTESLRVDARKDVPVWASWWVLTVLMFSLGLEWFIRRRFGLI